MSATEIDEYLVGAYLREVMGCDVVTYNVRPARGMDEFDVLGLTFAKSTAYLCGAATHIGGLNYGGTIAQTLARITNNLQGQREFADTHLAGFDTRFMFWSPFVPEGGLTQGLAQIEGLVLVINDEYQRRLRELMRSATETEQRTGNPCFRFLQILVRLRPDVLE
ncbi:hypothetical protein ACFL09_03135 [Planctomycetota bacterium]